MLRLPSLRMPSSPPCRRPRRRPTTGARRPTAPGLRGFGQRLGRHQHGRFDVRRIPSTRSAHEPRAGTCRSPPKPRSRRRFRRGCRSTSAECHPVLRRPRPGRSPRRTAPTEINRSRSGSDGNVGVVLDGHRRKGELRATAVQLHPGASTLTSTGLAGSARVISATAPGDQNTSRRSDLGCNSALGRTS